MTPHLTRIVLYTSKIDAMAQFYLGYFGYSTQADATDRIVELVPPGPRAILMLHPASKGQKSGQSLVKLVFDCADVADFCKQAVENRLDFGPLHQADGYVFANAKDPSGNSISVSSRAFRVRQ